MTTFEEYLKEQHMIDNPMLLDDDLPDDFERWLSTMEQEVLIQYADDWMKNYKKIISDKIDGYYDEISVGEALKIINK